MLGVLILFLYFVFVIILKDVCFLNNVVEFDGGNKNLVSVFMIEGRDRNILRGKF